MPTSWNTCYGRSGVVYFWEEADRRSYLNICCQEETPTEIVFGFFAFCPNFKMVPVTSYTMCFSVSITQPRSPLQWLIKKEQIELKKHCDPPLSSEWYPAPRGFADRQFYCSNLSFLPSSADRWSSKPMETRFSPQSLGAVSLPRLIAGWAPTKPFRLEALAFHFVFSCLLTGNGSRQRRRVLSFPSVQPSGIRNPLMETL